VFIKKTATYVIAQEAEVVNPQSSRPMVNHVQLEGIVAKTWKVKSSSNLFARLAVYDPQCEEDKSATGKNGYPRKKAHYCAVAFPGGKTGNGAAVDLAANTHVMVVGHVQEIPFLESLQRALLHCGEGQRILDHDRNERYHTINVYTVARSMTKFTQ
jgi:hypothetical protein